MSSTSSTNNFQMEKQGFLCSETTRYKVLDLLGEGTFGKVAKCFDTNREELAAIKIHKNNEDYYIQRELQMLEAVRALDPDKHNIVKFNEHFRIQDHSFLAFEMLDRSLWDLMDERNWNRLSLTDIRPVAKQLFVALEGLKSIGITHADIKLDNVMLVNHKDQPFRIKLIDFGLAFETTKAQTGMCVQNLAFRAPEVTLGLPLTEAIDMWSVGCVMAALYFGTNIFPSNCPYNWLRAMLELLGYPNESVLKNGIFSWLYFACDENGDWRLRSPAEFPVDESVGNIENCFCFCDRIETTLHEAVRNYPEYRCVMEFSDRMAFLDLLLSCLEVDPQERITPSDARYHSFIEVCTMDQSVGQMLDCYANPALSDSSDSAFNSYTEISHGKDVAIGSPKDAEDKESAHMLDVTPYCNVSPIFSVLSDFAISLRAMNSQDNGVASENHCDVELKHPVSLLDLMPNCHVNPTSSDSSDSAFNSYTDSPHVNDVAIGSPKDTDGKESAHVLGLTLNGHENPAFPDLSHSALCPKMSSTSSTNNLQLEKHSFLCSETTRYMVLDLLGEGTFGKVAKCFDTNREELAAIKIHKSNEDYYIQRELQMLGAVRALDPDKHNIVKFNEHFRIQDHSFLAFEMLDRSLWDLMDERNWNRLSLIDIRPVVKQLFVALEGLKSIGITHADIKLDNVMLVNHKDQPFRIKLIDFGLAFETTKAQTGMCVQNLAFRAPEVTLGLPLTEAIDMWSVGCVMAALYFGTNIFPSNCPYNWLRAMLELLGYPNESVLKNGIFSSLYFACDENGDWRLRSPAELSVNESVGNIENGFCFCDWIETTLHEAVRNYPEYRCVMEFSDRMAFLDLLLSCLEVDPQERITPSDARYHSFIEVCTMDQSVGQMLDCYANPALSDSSDSAFCSKMSSTLSTNNLQLEKHSFLCSETTRYMVLNLLGEGTFGKVAKCFDTNREELAAIKIHKSNEDYYIQRELQMLGAVRALDPDKHNIVKFNEHFRIQDHSFLAFEMLDRSLWDLMDERNWNPLSLIDIRPVVKQLFVALEGLKSIGITHADIKLDNVMLVNHKDQPFRIKLIDFGLAFESTKAQTGMCVQNLAFRAPEVTLGLPLTEAIDMWSVGCVMAALYFGTNIFPSNCPYNWLRAMLELLGYPNESVLKNGIFSSLYFACDENGDWRLRSPAELSVNESVGHIENGFWFCDWIETTLHEAVRNYPEYRCVMEFSDRMAFLDLLLSCLEVDPQERITPSDARYHSFIEVCTMDQSVGQMLDCYANPALSGSSDSAFNSYTEISHGKDVAIGSPKDAEDKESAHMLDVTPYCNISPIFSVLSDFAISSRAMNSQDNGVASENHCDVELKHPVSLIDLMPNCHVNPIFSDSSDSAFNSYTDSHHGNDVATGSPKDTDGKESVHILGLTLNEHENPAFPDLSHSAFCPDF